MFEHGTYICVSTSERHICRYAIVQEFPSGEFPRNLSASIWFQNRNPLLYFVHKMDLSKGLQCALMAITIVALWQLPHLGREMCAYTLFGLHCEVTRVLKLRTVSDALWTYIHCLEKHQDLSFHFRLRCFLPLY